MSLTQKYEMVAGVEIHAELRTKTKIFCGCRTDFGAPPNSQCCPVCTGMPGALPVLNAEAVHLAALAGLALHCRIRTCSGFARKHYFYPDLPKAYQITQHEEPLCEGGYLDIETEAGARRVHITRIHMEEDAGKLLHRPDGTLVDCNRCGVPLIEVVTEPCMHTPEEVRAFAEQLRAVLRYAGVSDGKMNEGSLRCDLNLSVRKKGERQLGTRSEIKNLNSFQFIAKAAQYEFERQAAVLEAGGTVQQETRRFDEKTGTTVAMRSKENAGDYRYFPEPDVPPVRISEQQLALWRREIPALPQERRAQYAGRWGISPYMAQQLTQSRALADYFEQTAQDTKAPKTAAGLLLGEVLRLAPGEDGPFAVPPRQLAALCDMLSDGELSSGAGKAVLQSMWGSGAGPRETAQQLGLLQISDEAELAPLALRVIAQNPGAAEDYRAGKTAALQALLGRCMKETRGRGNPVVLQQILRRELEK